MTASGSTPPSVLAQLTLPIITGVVVALFVALVVAAVKLVPRVLREFREQKAQAAENQRVVLARLAVQDDAIERLDREVHTNGGSSLKDAVLRTEALAKASDDKLDLHLTASAYAKGEIDAYIRAHP